jgi:uncharacterized protein
MIVELADIEGASRPFDFELTPEVLGLDDSDLKLDGDVHVIGEIEKTSAEVVVKGSITGEGEIECSRCLKPVAHKLKIDFQANFVTPEHFSVDKENEVPVSDLDTDVLDGDRIDINDIVREQILLNVPEQVFCEPDCKGLCPKCGANRNLIDCKCDLNETDPRWAALKNLR